MKVIFTALALLSSMTPRDGEEITWIHCSDTHAPIAGTEDTIKEMQALREIELEPYKFKARAPMFVIVTGDLTEFGGPASGKPAWDAYLGYWKKFTIPVFHGMGNHDATWDSLAPAIRKLHGGTNYSFNKAGIHFVSVDSTTPQEPRPSFGEEDIRWLADDLKKVKPETPVILYMHHPPEGNEFASVYDLDRFFDVLESHNIAAILVGHYHTAWHRVINGYDVVCGGSTFTKDEARQPRGYNVCSIKEGILRIAHKKFGEAKATIPLLEKKLTLPARPRIAIRRDGETVKAEIKGAKAIQARCGLDGEEGLSVKMTADPAGVWSALLPTQNAIPGIHFARVVVTCEDKRTYSKSVSFFVEGETQSEVKWRVVLPTSVKGQPRPGGDRLYVSGVDGKLYALKLADGSTEWTFPTGGEVLGSPATAADLVFFGSGDGFFRAVDTAGKEKWKYAAGAAVYSSPVVFEGRVAFGDNAGFVHALDAATGALKWKFQKAGYSVESALAADATNIYFSSWDENVYALDGKTGRAVWRGRAKGPSERNAATRYYGPGHCGPVVAGVKVFCADRDYKLSIFDNDGIFRGGFEDVSSAGVFSDGTAVLIRRPSGAVGRLDLKGTLGWSVPCGMDAVAAAPIEEGGIVYACSGRGLLSALDAGSGRILWQRQVTPKLYVFAPPAAVNRQVIVAGTDGSITCVASK